MEHNECAIEFMDGSRDWLDPVDSVDIVENNLVVYHGNGHEYVYSLEDVYKWVVRPYSEETTYDPID